MRGHAKPRGTLLLSDVQGFYESDIVIDSFTRWFAGAWHTPVLVTGPEPQPSEDYVGAQLGIAAQDCVLDFGCGVGVTTCRIAGRHGCRARGLNISPKQVGVASELARRTGLGRQVKFDLYGGVRFPYPAGTFDRALFFESPCHVPHRALLFEELFRVLRPGGTCGGQDWVLRADGIPGSDYETYIRPIEVATEVALVSLSQYADLMRQAGFTNVRTVDARDVAEGLATRFAGRPDGPVRLEGHESMEERLRLGDIALCHAFHQGLFTVGFLFAEKPVRVHVAARSTLEIPAAARPVRGAAGEPRACRLVPPEHVTTAVFSSLKNLGCINFHQRAFRVPESVPLAEFIRLVESSEDCTVESSCKVERGSTVHPARWNLFYHGDKKEPFLQSVLHFFDETARRQGLSLDDSLIRRFLDGGIDFRHVRKVVTGIDVRDNPERSRLKVWFMLAGSPALVERAIALHGDGAEVNALRLHDDFLVGFDLCFDGQSAIKLYPDVTDSEVCDVQVRRRLRGVLAPEALEAMDRCLWTHVYIARHNTGTVLQFHPALPDDFVKDYLPENARRALHAVYGGTRLLDMVVSMPEGELRHAPARHFALYYMPAEVPGRD